MPIDFSSAKAPPRKATTRKATPSRNAGTDSESLQSRREEGLNGLGQIGQLLCVSTRQYADGAAIGMHWGGIARETAVLADRYESVAKWVDPLIQMGPFTALIAAATPLILQIMVNHKVMPSASIPGGTVVAPEVLEARMKADMLRMQLQAERDQMEAEREFAQLQRDWEAYQAEKAQRDSTSVPA